ncbi:unnamed protein product [Amoebophrya sp. A25]|nr:unnamed protein product [Amoebophrya sp. A25]|eukprot:GSA25T00013193001.1
MASGDADASTSASTSTGLLLPAAAEGQEENERNPRTSPRRRRFFIVDKNHLQSACVIAPIWFCAQYSYAVGLDYTTVTSSTVISTTSCVPTFLLSLLFLRERPRWTKVLGVLACVAGNLVLTLGLPFATRSDRFLDREVLTVGSAKEHQPETRESPGQLPSDEGLQIVRSAMSIPREMFGDWLCVASTWLYASYCLLIKRWIREPLLFFSYLGVLVALFGFPLAYLATPEAFSALFQPAAGDTSSITPTSAPTAVASSTTAAPPRPPPPQQAPDYVRFFQLLGLLLLNGIGDNVLAQYFWAWGVLYTSPTVATVGLSCTVPLSIATDAMRGISVSLAQLVAAVLVLIGFSLLSFRGQDLPPDEEVDRTQRSNLETSRESREDSRIVNI